MNKLDVLIQELCPNGIEFKLLSDIEKLGYVTLGRGNVISKQDIIENPGEFPVYSSSALNNGEFGKYNEYMFDDERITWSIDGGGRFFYRKSHKYSVTNVSGWLKVENNKIISTKYLFYVLTNLWKSKSYNYIKKAHPSTIRDEYMIPLPHIKVQNEIVRILDYFTELTAELTAELKARKQQFAYYLNNFFGIDISEMIKKCSRNNIDIHSLEEIGTFTRGKRFVRDDIKETGVPCIHYGDLYTYYGISAYETKCFLDFELSKKMRFAKKGDVVIVQAGENDMDIGIGVAWLGDLDVAIHDACYIYKHNINPKYISYYLRSNVYHTQIKKYVSIGKICSISSQGIGKALIPVPPLEEQQRIVDILDKFDKLVNDINEGIPAEIAARQKQYEYYRDKLLTFKEVGNESI